MESELSGIFRVKLVTKNIVRGSPGTQFMHMRVNHSLDLDFHYFMNLYKKFTAEQCHFLVLDTTLASDNSLRFRKNRLEGL